ncbi:MAG TPA: alpha/beta hydrolase [Burkholderiales bacterium]
MSSALTVLVIVVVAFPLLMYLMQDQLLFHPQPLSEQHRHQVRQRFPDAQEVFLQADGVRLHAWHVKAQPGKPLVIYFGGNAEEVAGMLFEAPARAPGAGWLLVSYRGYGASEGSPSEAAITADALRWYDYAVKELGAAKVVVFGRSLGSGAAVYLASERKVSSVVLVTPFDSLVEVAKHHYPYLPVRLMLRHPFESVERAPKLSMPLLCIAAERDQVIPAAHARRLYDAWGGPKQWVELPGADHNSTDGIPAFWQSITAFLQQ